MIQDIYPLRLDNVYRVGVVPKDDSLVICFTDDMRILIHLDDEKLLFPTVKEIGNDRNYIYLFAVGDVEYYLLQVNEISKIEENECSIPGGCSFVHFSEIRQRKLGPKASRYAFYTAKHLNDWYSINKFCGRCGEKMVHSQSERAMTCPSCKNTVYPRIMPAVIVGVRNGDRILLTKYRTGFRENALVAGFTEIGESVEETVKREVLEEVGVNVKNITYYKSQPWGVASDILLGFFCDVDGDDSIHMDEGELRYAEWVKREDIILQSNDDSLTNEMMSMFKSGEM